MQGARSPAERSYPDVVSRSTRETNRWLAMSVGTDIYWLKAAPISLQSLALRGIDRGDPLCVWLKGPKVQHIRLKSDIKFYEEKMRVYKENTNIQSIFMLEMIYMRFKMYTDKENTLDKENRNLMLRIAVVSIWIHSTAFEHARHSNYIVSQALAITIQ